jgi:hypothetical protein
MVQPALETECLIPVAAGAHASVPHHNAPPVLLSKIFHFAKKTEFSLGGLAMFLGLTIQHSNEFV